jgi:iron complex outermembrane recepter protein
VFGALDWDFAERWTAGVELRWAEDDVTVTSFPVGLPALVFTEDFDSLTPRFTLAWRAQENTTYYLNAAKGTKPGDFNPRVPCVDPAQPAVGDESKRAVDEESAWNYELGLKSRLWEDRVTVALAGYYVEVSDQQVTELVENPCGGTLSLLRNSGRTEILGLETELAAELAAGFTISATYAYTDSEVGKWVSQEEADLRGSDGSAADNERLGDVAGRESPRVPEHAASLIVRYERPIAAGYDWYGSADYSYESSKYAAEHNLIETGDRNLVGLRTGLTTGAWDLSLWVRNLFDDETPVDVIRYFDRRFGPLPSFPQAGSPPSSTPRGFAIPLPPGRQAGVTLRYRF